MAWDKARSETRIRRHMETTPEIQSGVSLARSMRLNEVLAKSAADSAKFPRGKAVLVEGVHLYGQLLDFETLITQNNRETEQSHARVLRFLSMHYRVWDGIVDDDDVIRVDYHGSRLHAVVTEPAGNTAQQIKRAIALAAKLAESAKRVGDAQGFPSRVRFGIDSGACLAMSTGRAHEKDILFLGSPANHAAKMASGTEPGIYLTENAQRELGMGSVTNNNRQVNEALSKSVGQSFAFDRVEAATIAASNERADAVVFQFHRASPPLSKLNFEELTPSNSVRMGMASIFADIDGFTKYVDTAIQNGEGAIRTAVRDIHVLREELNSVLKDDFGGKRVRFIGDCIQGVLAEGDRQDDATEAVKEAVLCASGMRSSFSVAREVLKTIDRLDLAIGVEYGEVPLTRIGARGIESVRCAAGLAVIRSEQLQQSINGGGIRIGEHARELSNASMHEYFKAAVPLMEYADAADHFGAHTSPVVQIMRHEPSARPHTTFHL